MLDRLKSAYKAFSVQALVAGGTLPFWWPVVQNVAEGALGPKAQVYASVAIGVLGILGWTMPQKSIPKTNAPFESER